MEMIQFTTLSINRGEMTPACRMIMSLSAVKILVGRIYESTGNDPDMKSVDLSDIDDNSPLWHREVIWQRRMSFPCKPANTKAGRLLAPERSEKGNGTITTAPFTNLSMPGLLRALTSRPQVYAGWQGGLQPRRKRKPRRWGRLSLPLVSLQILRGCEVKYVACRE